MFGFSWTEIGWFGLTIFVGAVMWATQVGPNEAVSNLSEWARKCGIKDPPAWLRARATDRRVRRSAAVLFCALLFWGGMGFEKWLSPTIIPAGGTKVDLGPRKRSAIPAAPIPTSLRILFGPGSVSPKEMRSENVEWQAIEQTASGHTQKYTFSTLSLGSYDAQAAACLGNSNIYDDKCWVQYSYKYLELVLSFEKPITFKNLRVSVVQGDDLPKWTKVIMTETDAVLKFRYYPSDTLIDIEATDEETNDQKK